MSQKTLNAQAMREVYKTQAQLTDKQFDELLDGTRRINELELGGFRWHVAYLARDTYDTIPWSVHLEAWSAAHAMPYSGIDDFYKRAIAAGILPAWTLNRTTFHDPPTDKMPIGRLMVHLGLVSILELERALGIQFLIREELGLPTRIGRILGAIASLSLPDSLQALGLQRGLAYVNLEQTLPIIERVVAKRS